jgi:hypothetical protein
MTRTFASVFIAAILIALPASTTLAQDHGHTSEQLGSVHFATTCAAKVAPQFDRAVALLHSFEFGESIKTFTGVLTTDSTCAMAHWGIALSRWTNPMATGNRSPQTLRQGREAAAAATRLAARASAREREYINAVSRLYEDFEHTDQQTRVVAYEHAMSELVAHQPADTEAKIFHAISLVRLGRALPTRRTRISSRPAQRWSRLWAKQPNHPGLAHYIIHSYDYPALADKARAAAQALRGHRAVRRARASHAVAHVHPRRTLATIGQHQRALVSCRGDQRVRSPRRCMRPTTRCTRISRWGSSPRRKQFSTDYRRSPRAFDPNAVTGCGTGIGRRVRARGDSRALGPRAWCVGRGLRHSSRRRQRFHTPRR